MPTRLLGRVSSLEWLISTGLMPVSYAMAGPIAGLLGMRPTLIGAGLAGAAITLAFLFLPGMRVVEGAMPGTIRDNPATEERRRAERHQPRWVRSCGIWCDGPVWRKPADVGRVKLAFSPVPRWYG